MFFMLVLHKNSWKCLDLKINNFNLLRQIYVFLTSAAKNDTSIHTLVVPLFSVRVSNVLPFSMFQNGSTSLCPLLSPERFKLNSEVRGPPPSQAARRSRAMWKLTRRLQPRINSTRWLIRNFRRGEAGDATGLYGFDHLKTAKGFQRFVADAIERYDFYRISLCVLSHFHEP